MTVFFDDFNRADDTPGANWALSNYCKLRGQLIVATQASWQTAMCQSLASSGQMRAECDCYYVNADSLTGGPVVKSNGQVTRGYRAWLSTSGGSYYVNVSIGSSTTPLATSDAVAGQQPFSWHLAVEFDSGTVKVWYNGTEVISTQDMSEAIYTWGGLEGYGTGVRLDNFRLTVGSSAELAVSPSPIGNYGSPVSLTFTGTGTAWTAGTPGTPTFTVDHGTLTDQVVASETSATATYNPGNFLGTARFTDPSTGAYCDVTVTSNPGVVPVGAADPWLHDEGQLVVDTIHKTAPTLLRTDNIVLLGQWGAANLEYIQAIAEIWAATHYDYANPAGAGDLAQQLNQVWRIVNGGYTVPLDGYDQPDAVPIKQSVKIALDQLEAVRTANNWTLGSVITELAGTGVPTIRDVLDAVGQISGGSNQDVLDALAAYFGANPPTVEQLGTMVSDLATVAGYTLGDVLTAIAAIPGSDLSPIMDKLDAIQPSETFTLSTIAGDAGSGKTAAVAAEAALALLTGDGAITLATVLDAISALSDLVSALDTSAGAPVWPGIDGVDLLDPIAVTNAYTFTGTCDGILLSILQELVKQPTMKIGTISTYRTMGRVAFVSDSGEIEPWQPIPGSACVLMPRQMLHAGGFIIGFYHTVDATVVPWTIKASS